MEIMEKKRTFLDIVLIPKDWHRKIPGGLSTFIFGILLIGTYDIILNTEKIRDTLLKNGKLNFDNLLIALVFIIATGIVDILCFGYPLADFCNIIIRKRKLEFQGNVHTIVMSAYVLAHLILLPIRVFFIWLEPHLEIEARTFLMKVVIQLLIIYAIVEPFWWSGIIVRSVSSRTKLEFVPKALIFLAVMVWNNIISFAFQYLFKHVYDLYQSIVNMG